MRGKGGLRAGMGRKADEGKGGLRVGMGRKADEGKGRGNVVVTQ
jgi:hypothetical protein